MSYAAVGCIRCIVRMVSRDHDFIYCPHIVGRGVGDDNGDENRTVRPPSYLNLPWGVAANKDYQSSGIFRHVNSKN